MLEILQFQSGVKFNSTSELDLRSNYFTSLQKCNLVLGVILGEFALSEELAELLILELF